MKTSQPECEKFANRLIEAMLEAGQHSQRKSKTGVTTLQLRKVAKVTNEMARRYTLGLAWPDNEKMARIARWLGVRRSWLQYNEGPKRLNSASYISESDGIYIPSSAVSQLDNPQIILLQDCLCFALHCKKQYKTSLTERASAKAAASFFNHCLRTQTTPQQIPTEIVMAVLNSTIGSDSEEKPA